MPAPAVIPRSPFTPRTAQPPYSHVGNSTRAELDRLGLTAPRAMVDVEPYGSSHFLSVYFFSIDPQNSFDGSTNSPGYSVI